MMWLVLGSGRRVRARDEMQPSTAAKGRCGGRAGMIGGQLHTLGTIPSTGIALIRSKQSVHFEYKQDCSLDLASRGWFSFPDVLKKAREKVMGKAGEPRATQHYARTGRRCFFGQGKLC